ncbi:hypothetical protein ARMSODRAFT_797480 [Armillaria solidipes]|uniref:Uncharacterized protein n=1 Tax=Armillaria solidipes TaxID=1076256 RepID=A0A2H3BQU5_9AGAR|nr:hypothetical protein ARMSODRAFT_797480 [Armillaria solidipes]
MRTSVRVKSERTGIQRYLRFYCTQSTCTYFPVSLFITVLRAADDLYFDDPRRNIDGCSILLASQIPMLFIFQVAGHSSSITCTASMFSFASLYYRGYISIMPYLCFFCPSTPTDANEWDGISPAGAKAGRHC